ncbi:putative phosphite transport system-binding protein PtxB [Neomoorella glycerini]|uniref:Putative phosphite transport system-binding protein PtxB n=1 Tax=Neomoorella glycerini TaxID=55779 RepID=A0A6I5ZVD8_9FIRM|nr:phosphate/phosphite/phosphonate ABC transporter substrate-binding protein [Moorella glycerini]QGP93291.1 putative phosphite transport system-binding protein PtxB [Moorella glycerini]
MIFTWRLRLIFLLALISLILLLSGCAKTNREGIIKLNDLRSDYPGASYNGPAAAAELKRPLRLAAAPVISPEEGYQAYTDLARYLEDYLEYPVEFITRQTYAEVNLLMNSGDIDIAFICTYAYVKGQRDFGMELVAASEVGGRAKYASYIIVPKSSPVKDFAGLKGRRFAFSDPMSMSGRLVPLYYIQQKGERPETFFQSYIFTYSHDKSIRAVADGIVDGAAVDSLVYEAFAKKHPDIAAKVKIIQRSDDFASPPVVMRPGLDPALKAKVREAFLQMDRKENGRKVLNELGMERFTAINDEAYNSVREIARKVGYP